MSKKNKIAIFFGDMTEKGKKRVATQGLTEVSEYRNCAPDQIKVDDITVDDDTYGYDEDPKKQELLEHVHVETPEGYWLMGWDCFKHEFQTIMKELDEGMKARLKSIRVNGIYDPKEPGQPPQMNTWAVNMEFYVRNKHIRKQVRLLLVVDSLAERFEETKDAKSEFLTQKLMEYARHELEDEGIDTADIDFTDVENVVGAKMPLLLQKVINHEYFVQNF